MKWCFRGLSLACALLAACGGDEAEELPGHFPVSTVAPAVMFSAFGGSHAYVVTPAVTIVGPSEGTDPLLASSLVWHVDERLASIVPFDGIPAAVNMTTRGWGSTRIDVHGRFRSGAAYKGRSHLTITQASDEDWNRGDGRYHNGPRPSLATLLATIDAGVSDCDALSASPDFPRADSACVACHDEASSEYGLLLTPVSLAGFSDDELLALITEARKPAGWAGYRHALLRKHPQPDCVFTKLHSFAVDEQDRLGLVLKLRSLPPRLLDYEREWRELIESRAR